MAQYELGQAIIVNRGAWSSSASYVPLNIVTRRGGTFLCTAANSNKEPGAIGSGWESYWINMAKGIANVTVTSVTSSTAALNITMSDGTVIAASSFNTATVGDGTITDAKIVSTGISKITAGAVTAAKLGSDILPANVGIKHGNHNPPTTSDISNGQIYLYHT